MKQKIRFALATCAVMAAGVAGAEEYRATNFLPPVHPVTIASFDEWAVELKEMTSGRLSFQVFNGGSLVPGKETIEAVGNGVAQAGFIVSVYTPSKLPRGNSVAHFAWEFPDKYALAGAYADWMLNDPDASKEWIDAGTIYGQGFSTPAYYLLCSKPIHNVAEAAGMRVRTPGAAYPGYVESIGGVSVNMGIGETYDAMDKGALDCLAGDITHLISGANLRDLVKGVTLTPMGPSIIGAAQVYNLEWYRSLSEEDRRNLWTAAANGMARQQIRYTADEDAGFAFAKENNIEIIEPDATLEAAMKAYIATGMNAVEDAKKYGVADPEAVFASFRPYLEKWTGLVVGLKDRRDVAELTQLYREHLYDKVDVATYGMK